MDSAISFSTLDLPARKPRVIKRQSPARKMALLLAPDMDDEVGANNYTKFLIIASHYQLTAELASEIRKGIYIPDPKASPKWLAMCYERSQQIAANLERLSFVARLKLFITFQEAALYSHLGYQTLSDWAVSQADSYKGDGPRWEHRFIGEKLIPFCEQNEVFESPKALAEWLTKPGFLYRTRQILAEIKRVLEQVPTIAEKVFAIKGLLLLVENKNISSTELRKVASGGIKVPVKITKQGSDYLITACLDENQLESFIERNQYAMILEFDSKT